MPTAPTLGNWIGLYALGHYLGGPLFLGVALALDGFGPVSIAAGRIALGALTLGAVALIARIPLPRDPVIWAFTAAMAVLSKRPALFLLSWSQQHVSSGFAGIHNGRDPAIRDRAGACLCAGRAADPRQRAAGFAIGLLGVAELIGPGVLRNHRLCTGKRGEGWAVWQRPSAMLWARS